MLVVTKPPVSLEVTLVPSTIKCLTVHLTALPRTRPLRIVQKGHAGKTAAEAETDPRANVPSVARRRPTALHPASTRVEFVLTHLAEAR